MADSTKGRSKRGCRISDHTSTLNRKRLRSKRIYITLLQQVCATWFMKCWVANTRPRGWSYVHVETVPSTSTVLFCDILHLLQGFSRDTLS